VEATRAGCDNGLHADVGAGVAKLACRGCDLGSAAGHAERGSAHAQFLAQGERGVLAVGGAHGGGRRADQGDTSRGELGAQLGEALEVERRLR
jgi:hypothetical protein